MQNLFDISGKVALVTGGSRGIGEMIATGYVENGAKVYVSSRKATVCQQIADKLSERGTCIALPADVSTLAGIESLVAEITAREQKLDILVNNAGATWGAAIDDYPESGWDKVVDLNMKSVFFMTQKLLPLLRASASAASPARVINIASINGINPTFLETYAYTSSKAGCIMLTRHLAKRLAAENILVNAIAPGPFPSQMMAATLAERGDEVIAEVPLGRIGQPEDIAGVAIFLASRAGAYTTGATIPCDGGAAEV
ncbi:MAG: 3-oxoacyl-ACP reductase [Tistrella sp.]|uniref:3-oxoacyl-ACP reductase n=1 Tax=Tistrella mobilis TaxID=171437 RepID=A0A3B9IRK7_9PROT|nr:SDR family oxidoreductase [Tistrella sp.]MAD38650.1 3-oxoacyl-ACP reductase [Tistrella sp.]MBA76671.1 3-oxoacyl-ACP reductase [Tistrella sp.]HAE49839.1 3-oxoacyl-ACP reductase [Tistrella mobilis]|tara:strand:+ start:154 stop:921 length:768 start_codon:yes stop_codon:yes gene_type:complete